jgi:hypothetical protein
MLLNILQSRLRGRQPGSGGSGSEDILFSTLGLTTNDPLTVLADTTVVIDISTPALGLITAGGTIRVDDDNLTVTATGIVVSDGGAFEAGTEAVPLVTNTEIILNGAYVPLTGDGTNVTNPGQSRGIMVEAGGRLDLHGTPPATLWTTLNANYTSGTAMTLATSPGWTAQDLVIATTDFPSTWPSELGHTTEQRTGTTSGTALTLSSGLDTERWGVLQYPVDTLVSGSGMALTQNTFSVKKAHAETPVLLDERARVLNLTRNLKVSAPNDTDWSDKGHGVHIMWMASGLTLSLVRITGVQIRRGGQAGALGRYPFHAHMNSYIAATGVFTADTPLNYVKKSVVWESQNRAYTIHGTCGMTMHDNIGYDIRGHAFFSEDASERRNDVRRNSMIRIRAPWGGADANPSMSLKGDALPGTFVSMAGNGTTNTVNWTSHGLYSGQIISVSSSSNASYNCYRKPVTVVNANQFTYLSAGTGAATATFRYGNNQIKDHDYASSGYWITNMDNYFEDNYASDCFSGDKNQSDVVGTGVWVSLGPACTGSSVNVTGFTPDTLDTLLFKGFTAHSCYGNGMVFGFPVQDDLGTVANGNKYTPTAGSFDSTDHVFWKNNTGAYFNSVGTPNYLRWTTADNGQVDFRGSTNNGSLSRRHLLIGHSLNNANPDSPSPQDIYPRAGFFPYHGTVFFQDITAVNFPYAAFVYRSDQDKGSAGGVVDGAPDNYDVPGVDAGQAANTNIRLINSHSGEMCPPLHLDGRPVDTAGYERAYSIACVWYDGVGQFGTAGHYMIPYSRDGAGAITAVDDYFLSGAVAPVDGPTSGQVVCKTTATRYFGAGYSDQSYVDSDTLETYSSFHSGAPFTITRKHLTTGATIGTPYLKKDAFNVISQAFTGYATWPMQNGARFRIDFTDGTITVPPPASFFIMTLTNANVSGDHLLLEIPWANASVPRICFGNSFSNESISVNKGHGGGFFSMNTFASAADVTANRATLVTTVAAGANDAAKIAAVLADTTGMTYFRDTTNNRVYVRYTAKPFTANTDPSYALGAYYDTQFVIVKV